MSNVEIIQKLLNEKGIEIKLINYMTNFCFISGLRETLISGQAIWEITLKPLLNLEMKQRL